MATDGLRCRVAETNGAAAKPFSGPELARLESLVANLSANVEFSRQQIFTLLRGPESWFDAIDGECGWPGPDILNPWFYRSLYDRNPIAARVVELMPKECWRGTPTIYETESAKDKDATEFEKAWDALCGQDFTGEQSWYSDEEGAAIWPIFQRADINASIATCGIMFLNIDDGKNLDEPADGVVQFVGNGMVAQRARTSREGLTGNKAGAVRMRVYPSRPQAVPVREGTVAKEPDGDLDADTFNEREEKLVANAIAANRSPLTTNAMKDRAKGLGTDAQYYQTIQGTERQYFGYGGRSQMPADKPSKKQHELLFVRTFDESLFQTIQYEADIRNPRFGKPVMYLVTLNDPRVFHAGGIGLSYSTVRIHWSRVIHLAEVHGTSEIFAMPRLQVVANNVLDLRKLYGGSAEGYWSSANPGLSIETNPQSGGDVDVNIPATQDRINDYFSRLRRALVLVGLTAKSLAPQVVDPTPQISAQIEAICIYLGCPVRVFKGSERGELASSQDDSDWNGRVQHRQKTYLTPKVIVPFVDRLIAMGVLPEPSGYSVEWPDLDSVTKKDKAGIALQVTQALVAYEGGGSTVLAPRDFLVRVLGWDEEEADQAIEAAEKAVEEKQDDAQAIADEHGMEPVAPPGFEKPPPPPVVVAPGAKPSKTAPPAKAPRGQTQVKQQGAKQ